MEREAGKQPSLNDVRLDLVNLTPDEKLAGIRGDAAIGLYPTSVPDEALLAQREVSAGIDPIREIIPKENRKDTLFLS